MIRYQQGELRAFEDLYRELSPRLFRFLIYKGLREPLAEDLLQESFLQIHRSRHTYQPPRPVAPWAFAISRHLFLMHLRAQRRKPVTNLDQGDWARLEEEVGNRDLESSLTLEKALRSVSPQRKECLLLHYYLGFTFTEIGALLDISAGAAKLRSYRALQDLRRIVRGSAYSS
ncbi:MAG TPA: RNA polymerase sigma factor [Acidobacteriota bacterium]|nr:RNA polymerase sigma factor [Acidobacteriota bacterium]